jgi:predicted nucleotidyltransferase
MLKVDFKRLRNEALRDIILALEEALEKIGIDYYLIGALARDAWFQQDKIVSRTTADVDFAILVPQKEKFEELKTFLAREKGYVETRGNSFAMISPGGITVDILPFGSIEIDEELNMANGEAQVVTNGFKEVFSAALEQFESEDGQLRIKIASLPGIVLLKLIAHQDRPEIRIKDPGDILEILHHYFDLHSELIYEHHDSVFDDEQPMQMISARVIGREIRKIVLGNPTLHQRVNTYLTTEIEKQENGSLIRLMQRSTEKYTQEEVTAMLNAIVRGMSEIKDG